MSALVLAWGCTDAPTGAEPAPMFKQALPAAGASGITVMTRNVYVGADVDRVISAPTDQLPLYVTQAYLELLSTDFPTRARALVDEIAAARPHLVGLQEITLIRTQIPGDFLVMGDEGPTVGNPMPNATDVLLDYEAILLAELAARGLDYAVAARIQDTDVELPGALSETSFFDVRQTDFDLILVRGDVAWSNPDGANYAAALPVPFLPGYTLSILRGWVSVDATVAGRAFRFVNTHLESFSPLVRVPQAQELLLSPDGPVAGSPLPVILVGDLNADAVSVVPGDAYALLTGAGFVDVWNASNARGTGLTCCFSSDLRDPFADLHSRIDLVLARGLWGPGNSGIAGGLWAEVVGEEPGDREMFEGGGYYLWPSDHAGVVATLKLPRNGK
jgi:hypothetical protein